MFDNSLHPRCAMSIPDLDPMISTIAWEDFMAERYVCVVESLFRLKREILENDGKLTFILAESLRAIGRLADANSVIGDDQLDLSTHHLSLIFGYVLQKLQKRRVGWKMQIGITILQLN